MRQEFDPADNSERKRNPDSDLARRLARYRLRVEAENRPRSVKFIDRAIEEAGRPDSEG